MRIDDLIWRSEVIDKLAWKHGIDHMKSTRYSTTNLTFDTLSVATVLAKMFMQQWDKRKPADI